MLNDKIIKNNEKLQNIRKQETEVTRLKENIEDKIGDNAIPGIIEEKEETFEEGVIGEKPKQYKKTKNKGDGNNGK